MKDIPQSQKFGLVSLTERKMAELRNRGHKSIMVVGGEKGIIRIKSINPKEETVVTEVSLNSIDSWLRDYFARRNSIGKGLRNLDRDFNMSMGPENFRNGAVFGPNRDSALLYLNRFAASYPENGEAIYEGLTLEELENGGNPGVSDHSALLIVEALLKEVDRNGRNN